MIARFEAQALVALVNLVGHTWNGKDIVINVTSEVQDDVGVTVYKYQPHLFQNLSMTMAVLLSDPDFITSWKTDEHIQYLNHGDTVGIFKEQCSHSELLKARFQICGNKWGWQAQIARISLDPWQPADRRIFFRILRKAAGAEESRQSKPHEIKIQFSNDESPAFWAVPEDNCEFPAVHPDSLESPSQDLSVPFKQAMVSLGSSPRAMCNYIKRNCEHILVPNPVQSSDGKTFITKSFGEIVRGAFKATWQSRASGRTISQIASSMVAPLLRCARQAKQELPWAQVYSWQADLAIDEAEEHFGKVSPDIIWIKGFGDEQLSGQVDERLPPPLPVEVKDLFKIVNDTDSDSKVDAALIRDACRFLYRPIMYYGRMRKMEAIKEVDGLVDAAAIQEILLAAVLDTSNPAAVQLFGRWCFSDSLLMSEHQRENAVQLVWESAQSSRNDLQILNEVLHWNEGPRIDNNAGFVNALLQFATSKQCLECCNLLPLVVREQGDKWSPLFFGDFRLGLGQNSLNFLQPNITVPWLCIENNLNIYYTEFPGFETSKPIAPALVHGLQDFWKQLKMCDRLTSGPKRLILDEDVLLNRSELDSVISLSPKVFVTLDPDETNYLVEELEQITAMKNLELLGLFWKAVDTTVSNIEQILKLVGAKLKRFDGRNPTLRTNIKPKALASTKTEKGLPGLVLRVGGKHITSMALRNWVVTDVDAKALGAALTSSSVEEIDIRDNKEITDEGAVALITPLLESNSSSLRGINMAFTSITDAGLHVFGETLQSLQNGSCSLTWISVWQYKSHSTFGDEGVASLLRGLERCPNLVYVDAEGPNLRSQTVQNALQALNVTWPNLTDLYVTYENQYYNLRRWSPWQ